MNFTDIRAKIMELYTSGVLSEADVDQLNNEQLWTEVEHIYRETLTADLIERNLTVMAGEKRPGSGWGNFVKAWFKGLQRKREDRQEVAETARKHGACEICATASETVRHMHIRELAAKYYTHLDYDFEIPTKMRHIPLTMELLYQHARTTQKQAPEIAKWAKIVICEIEMWDTTPFIKLSYEDQKRMIFNLWIRHTYDHHPGGMPVGEIDGTPFSDMLTQYIDDLDRAEEAPF